MADKKKHLTRYPSKKMDPKEKAASIVSGLNKNKTRSPSEVRNKLYGAKKEK